MYYKRTSFMLYYISKSNKLYFFSHNEEKWRISVEQRLIPDIKSGWNNFHPTSCPRHIPIHPDDYHYLEDGEMVEPGDEYLNPRLGWSRRFSEGGYRYQSQMHPKMRRKVLTLREKIIGAF